MRRVRIISGCVAYALLALAVILVSGLALAAPVVSVAPAVDPILDLV